MRINDSLAKFLDALVGGLNGESWVPQSNAPETDLQWWSCALSVDSACRFMAGAPAETWNGLGADDNAGFAQFAAAVQAAAAAKFGSEVVCEGMERSDSPEDEEWTAATLKISSEASVEFLMSTEFAEAFGAAAASAEPVAATPWPNSADLLMNVEIPVSVSLGRRQMRMKDLLGLTHGSIVELDQELGDDVEIRVNNSVIARGEVVAVDGNYAVRILKMVTNDSGTGLRRLP
jgi:flagellar motor switch protein FliN